jgi:hypothetical protein
MAKGGGGGAGNQWRTVSHRGADTPVSTKTEGEPSFHTVKGIKRFHLCQNSVSSPFP